jgi:hypothetical protein
VGTPMNPDNCIKRSYRPLLKRAGLLQMGFRDLRHTFASLMMPNEHPKIVQEMLGHSRISTTLDIYSHLSQDMQEGAVGRLAVLFSWRVTVKFLSKGPDEKSGPFAVLRFTCKRGNFSSELGRTRTCDLLIRSWFARVRIHPNVSEDLAYLCRLRHFIATPFSPLFSSVLVRLQYIRAL